MFKLEKCSNLIFLKNCQILKIVQIVQILQIQKLFKFKNLSILKFVQIRKSSSFEIYSNFKKLKFKNCSNLKLFRFKTEKNGKKKIEKGKKKNKLGRPNIPGVGVRWPVTDLVGRQDLPTKSSYHGCAYIAPILFPAY
jgi:hypothetical protein